MNKPPRTQTARPYDWEIDSSGLHGDPIVDELRFLDIISDASVRDSYLDHIETSQEIRQHMAIVLECEIRQLSADIQRNHLKHARLRKVGTKVLDFITDTPVVGGSLRAW